MLRVVQIEMEFGEAEFKIGAQDSRTRRSVNGALDFLHFDHP